MREYHEYICMTTKSDTVGRVVMVVVCATLVVTVFAGIVGAVWRLALWQTMHGPHGATAMQGGTFAGPGFEMGFGVPLSAVVAWAMLVGVAVAVGFLVIDRVGGDQSIDGLETVDGDGR